MTVRVIVNPSRDTDTYETASYPQHVVDLMWNSRGKWYPVSEVTITHNEEFPTPAISITEPQPGIRFTVYDQDGNVVYSNKKEKEGKS